MDIGYFEGRIFRLQLLQKYVQYVAPAIEVLRSLVNSVFTIIIVWLQSKNENIRFTAWKNTAGSIFNKKRAK